MNLWSTSGNSKSIFHRDTCPVKTKNGKTCCRVCRSTLTECEIINPLWPILLVFRDNLCETERRVLYQTSQAPFVCGLYLKVLRRVIPNNLISSSSSSASTSEPWSVRISWQSPHLRKMWFTMAFATTWVSLLRKGTATPNLLNTHGCQHVFTAIWQAVRTGQVDSPSLAWAAHGKSAMGCSLACLVEGPRWNTHITFSTTPDE